MPEENVNQNQGQQTDSNQRPAWLPEKFATVEQMAMAYGELEKKLGAQGGKPTEQNQQTQEQTPPAEGDKAKGAEIPTDKNAAADALAAKGLNLSDFQKEFNDTGALTQESYDKLAGVGIDKATVDAYIAGQAALAEQQVGKIYAAVGGQDQYKTMVQWAAVNMTDAEKQTFNNAVNGTEQAALLAVEGLKSRFIAANGRDPKLATGTGRVTGEVYNSKEEMTRDMRDPRYKSDPAFRNMVAQKLGRSKLTQ